MPGCMRLAYILLLLLTASSGPKPEIRGFTLYMHHPRGRAKLISQFRGYFCCCAKREMALTMGLTLTNINSYLTQLSIILSGLYNQSPYNPTKLKLNANNEPLIPINLAIGHETC